MHQVGEPTLRRSMLRSKRQRTSLVCGDHGQQRRRDASGESLLDQSADEWERMINVNVFGVLNGVRAVLRSMLQRKDGIVVNISSIAGVKLFPNHSVYCATKFVHAPHRRIAARVLFERCACCSNISRSSRNRVTGTHDERKGQGWLQGVEGDNGRGCLVAQDVADAVLFATSMPKRCCVREIQLAPTNQVP